ncbi:MAG: phosphate signaling complex protein PhoU [Gracilibacteraceae bacterium]|jgi:phosphate transport system protein|nr:phosphate signaling complex protein PhoU [Gracilibacteraceae bacterium]
MRGHFDDELAKLNNSLIEMGALIEDAIARAARALENQDVETARGVLAGDDRIDDKEKEIESRCLRLLIGQHPVARDFRQISTALKMITDMERIGDQAADICEICLELSGRPYIPKLEPSPLMADATMRMVTRSIDAYVKKDADLAQDVIESDDDVDRLYLAVRAELIDLVHEDPANGEQAFDLMQIAKYFERIGDHACNIAEWVIFFLTGRHKDQQVF